MTKPVITVSSDVKLSRVIKLMGRNNIGSVVVVDDEIPIGIFTERDLVKLLAREKAIENIQVDKVMTKPIKKVGLEATVLDITKMMNKHSFRRVVVVDNEGKIAGIITERDLIRLMSC
jgi:CBS domain-containing protein